MVENRSRAYCEARQRAGLLEAGTVELLREIGLAARMDAEGLEHGGIYLQFAGERHHLDFRDLTGGRWVTIYAQTEIVKDLIRARLAAGAHIEFEVSGTEVSDLDTDRPVLRFTDAAGTRHEVSCDAIAGCDGFHGVCRDSMPPGLIQVAERGYPYSWLGILATVPPSTDELIYCRHEDGFALHTMRTPQVSRLYLQVSADEDIAGWPDDRIWAVLRHRLEVPGWELKDGPITEKAVSPMRSFVAFPMRYRRLFLAGDAAHIVPPTGAKGLNLAIADVTVLAARPGPPAARQGSRAGRRVLRQLPEPGLAGHAFLLVDDVHAARGPAPGPVRRRTPALPAALRGQLPRRRHHPGRELHRLLPPPLALAAPRFAPAYASFPRRLRRLSACAPTWAAPAPAPGSRGSGWRPTGGSARPPCPR